ncbi:hypothetical protein AVEN_230967-1 [Araneus ventricosus]|uniref:Uncharacterized protein n=1 Tax=Araneus ventricosus TaxID=182803 RepID=A0A4Y2A3R3_ARAVE|nr:hypothetical protein AVEN_230967-1 [Araneus ventricosus]
MITLVSAKIYALLKNLVQPEKPKDQELTAILENQLNPKPPVISETFRFHKRNQAEGAEFCAHLKKLLTNCEFGQFLNDSLRDRFVCGLRSEAIQKKLSQEANLIYERAINIAIAMEKAARDADELHTMSDSKSVH